jgi:hypothetical protein
MPRHIFWDWVRSVPLGRRRELLNLFLAVKIQQLHEQPENKKGSN